MTSYPVVTVWRRKVTSSIHYVCHVIIQCVRRVYPNELLMMSARLSVLSASESLYYHKSYIDRWFILRFTLTDFWFIFRSEWRPQIDENIIHIGWPAYVSIQLIRMTRTGPLTPQFSNLKYSTGIPNFRLCHFMFILFFPSLWRLSYNMKCTLQNSLTFLV